MYLQGTVDEILHNSDKNEGYGTPTPQLKGVDMLRTP